MSDALRAMADAADSAFDQPPGGMPPDDVDSTAIEAPPQAEPPSHAEHDTEPEPQAEPTGDKGDRKLSKYDLAKAKAAREAKAKDAEKRRIDSAFAKAAAAEKERNELLAKFDAQEKRIKEMEQQQRLAANPLLKDAIDLLGQGYKPEDAEAHANALAAQGDHDGAAIARNVARHMREAQAEQQKTQQAEAQAKAQSEWRNIPYGTIEFDNAVLRLQPGSQDFNDAWSKVEAELVEARKKSPDPWDQECAKQFYDHNSEFGKRMEYFLKTPMGQAFSKSALGMIPSWHMVKQTMIIDTQAAVIANLKSEIQKLNGFTGLGSGSPVNGGAVSAPAAGYEPRNGGSAHSAEDRRAFESLPLERQRAWIRSRESQG